MFRWSSGAAVPQRLKTLVTSRPTTGYLDIIATKPNTKFGTQTRTHLSPRRLQLPPDGRAGRTPDCRERPLALSSGVDNSDWNMLAVTVFDDDGKTPIDWRLCLVPKSDYTIIDTWYAMGVAATGSKDIAVTELFVPERRALALMLTRGGLEHPGGALNAGPLFRIPVTAASSHPLAPAALGAAEGAYEIFVETTTKRVGTYTGARVADFQAVQIKVARARTLIDSARYLLRQSALELQAAAERNDIPDVETNLRLGTLRLCRESGWRCG